MKKLTILFLLICSNVFAINQLGQMSVGQLTQGLSKKSLQAGKFFSSFLQPNTQIKRNGQVFKSDPQPTWNPQSVSDYLACGRVMGDQKRWAEALALFQKAIEIDYNSIDAHYCAGVAYLNLGDKESSLKEHAALKRIAVTVQKRIERLQNKIAGN